MRTHAVIVVIVAIVVAVGIGGCYSSGQQIPSDDLRMPQQPSAGRTSSGQGGDAAAPSAAVPGRDATAGSAPGASPAAEPSDPSGLPAKVDPASEGK